MARALPHGRTGAEAALRAGAAFEAEQILAALLANAPRHRQASELELLHAKALVDQSKAEAALPILGRLCVDETLPPSDVAEATCLRAAAMYLLNREGETEYASAAETAVVTARKAGSSELTARSLFEYARSGAETGDERRVRDAQTEIQTVVLSHDGSRLPIAWYALAYCHYFFFDLEQAAQCIERSIALLSDSPNAIALSLAHNALGVCKYYSSDLSGAHRSLDLALAASREMGDDSRFSLTAANLCALYTLEGRFDEAVRVGLMSVNTGNRVSSQPRLTIAYTNLAEAHMMLGQTQLALDCMASAERITSTQRSWRSNVEFLIERAQIALMMGNTSLALDVIGRIEKIASGRERAVPELGAFEKLRIFRAAHVQGHQEAYRLAVSARETFRARHNVHYMQALAATAWLEARAAGLCSAETEAELSIFDKLGARGLRAAVAAQGFFSRDG